MLKKNLLDNAVAVFPGMYITKDGALPEPDHSSLEALGSEISTIADLLSKSKDAVDQQFKDLHTHYAGKESTDELAAVVKEHTDTYAEMVVNHQKLSDQLDVLKKEIAAPAVAGGSDLVESDKLGAIELQKRIFVEKGGDAIDFKEDHDNLVDMPTLRTVVRKMMRVGLDTKREVFNRFSDDEKKAFEAASLDSAFFTPEILGLEVDCNIECDGIVDLYGQDTVSKTTFQFPRINDYGAIGEYTCDAVCDAPYGPEGNIQYLQGQTYDWRGLFCFQKKVLQEANYDLLAFMIRSIQRSYRINKNIARITGDGENEPLGWLTADVFTKLKTPNAGATQFNHQDFRRFLSSAPMEYGPVVATMHQNVFAYLASALDANSRFIFGDGDIMFSPSDTSERIRISNCLPDATENGTRGSTSSPLLAGSFLAAAGNWEMAYRNVEKRPMFMEQYEGGGPTAWCVKYQFGAEDGAFIACPAAARTLYVG